MSEPAVKVRSVEVTAGIDEAQVKAAATLHAAQAAEKGCVFDVQAWAEEVAAKIKAGLWNVGIAWDGDRPVGVVEMHVEYDPIARNRVAFGQRAYVLPDYRQVDVFSAVFDAGMAGSEWLGVTTRRACAETDWVGSAMKRFYASKGFKVIGYVMEQSE